MGSDGLLMTSFRRARATSEAPATSTPPRTSARSRSCSSRPDTQTIRGSRGRSAALPAIRQRDGGWAIPMRTLGHRYRDFLDVERYPEPLAPDRSKPFSHLVTGMVLRPSPPIRVGTRHQTCAVRESSWRAGSSSAIGTATEATRAIGNVVFPVLVHRHRLGARHTLAIRSPTRVSADPRAHWSG